jgi:hypothetical protein
MTPDTYFEIVGYHAIILSIIWSFNMLLQIIHCAIHFINDTRIRWGWWGDRIKYNNLDGENFMLFTGLIGMIVILLASLLWPFIMPTLATMGFLFGARAFVRFKKRINKALKLKE